MAYATPDEVRAELGDLSDEQLSDAEAGRLIANAEDLIDAELALAVDPASGRKVVQADVTSWQWDKVNRATVLVAAELYSNPDLARGRQWAAERGADHEVSGPRGHDLGRQVVALLASTGWRPAMGSVTLVSPYDSGDTSPLVDLL